MNVLDRVVLYGQAVVLAAILGIVVLVGLYVRTEVEAVKATTSPMIQSAHAVQETAERIRQRVDAALDRFDRWESRLRRMGVPVDEETEDLSRRHGGPET